MTNNAERFSIDALCSLTDTPRRTVRFYIQEELVDRPLGAKRGAYYTRDHLEQLLTIRKWKRAGLSLERIRELLARQAATDDLPPEEIRRPGHVAVRSHILLRPGVELVIDPAKAGLTPEDVRALARHAAALTDKLKEETSR